MKKNRMMRAASALLVAVLLTTCTISGTFAKYVSTATANDKARVAYWGWATGATIAFDLFDGEYDVIGDAATVDSENGDNVVAPGTSKEETFVFAYTPKTAVVNALQAGAIAAPEVDYNFTVTFTATGDYDELDDNANFYWTLNGVDYQTVEDLTKAVLKLSGDPSGSCDYKHGTLPEAFATELNSAVANTIGWTWVFYEDTAGDAADTAMGNMQDLNDITFEITITATQLD